MQPSQDLKFSNFTLYCCFIILLGFLITACFALPYADDFGYAKDSANGIIPYIYNYYMSWGGRYSAAFFTAIMARAFNEQYWAVGWLIILSTLCGFTILLKTILHQWKRSLLAAVVICGFYFTITPSIFHGGPAGAVRTFYESLFWIAGAATYQLGNVFFILLLASLNKYFNTTKLKVIYFILSTIFLILTIGSNETILFAVVILSGFAWIISIASRKQRIFWSTILLIALVFSLISVLAPGNTIRAADFPKGHQLFFASYLSTIHGLTLTITYLINPFFWLYLVTIYPLINKLYQLYPAIINHINLLFVAMIGLVILLFFPSGWAVGGGPPARAYAVIATIAIIILPVFIIALIYQHQSYLPKLYKFIAGESAKRSYVIVLLLGIITCFVMAPNLLAMPYALLRGKTFHNRVQACKLYNKTAASTRCLAQQNYPNVQLLGGKANIVSTMNFGYPLN